MLPQIETVRLLAEAGDLRYALLLSCYYYAGVHIGRDERLSEHWYGKAYKAVSAEYLCHLGELRELGAVVRQDFSSAKAAYTEAMELDEMRGAYMLARLALNAAVGNPYRNRQIALDFLTKAAAQGHVPSRVLLLRNGMRSGLLSALGSMIHFPGMAATLIRTTFDRQVRPLWRYKDVFPSGKTIQKYVGDDRLYLAPRSIHTIDVDRLAPGSASATFS